MESCFCAERGNIKPFFTVQRSGSYTKTLEVIKYIGLNTLQTGLGGFDAVRVDTKGQDVYKRQEQGNISTSYNEQYLTSGNKYQYSAGNNTNRNRNMNSSLGLSLIHILS